MCLAHRIKHQPRETISRHHHVDAFAAVVLQGGYVEAGDTGRHRVEAGDVVLHRCFEGHLDRIDTSGAQVLVLEFDSSHTAPVHGRVNDPDLIARLAERDVHEARLALLEQMAPHTPASADWPDALARTILADPGVSITEWAVRHRLHPGTVSRGFRQQFEVCPASFRLQARAQRALRLLIGTNNSLADVAIEAGFADQPHMSRTLKALTGLSTRGLRGRATQRRQRRDIEK